MNIVLFDCFYDEFLPLTYTRPVGDLRCGILTFAERWSKLLNSNFSFLTKDYLSEKYPYINNETSLFINPCVFPNEELISKINTLPLENAIYYNDILVAVKTNLENFNMLNFSKYNYEKDIDVIKYPWDLFSYNFKALTFDFNLLTSNKISQELSKTVGVLGDVKNIFLEEGAIVEFCTLNVKEGPIYIGKNAQILEGSTIRGPISLGNNSFINMGSKIYGGTTIGPFCKVGGEVHNSIFWGYTNKGHEGFVGNSVIGQWCNFGADSNTSNMKNNYADVKCWSFKEEKFINTKLQFCGTIMADHSKTAINTQLNTGTIIGFGANVFYAGFPPNYIEHFSWGGERNGEKFQLNKFFEVVERVMKRRNIDFDIIERNIISNLYSKFINKK